MYQRKVNVDLNGAKSVLADASSVIPSSEQSTVIRCLEMLFNVSVKIEKIS